MDTRKFSLEGSLHLFSSEANMLSPAELYMVNQLALSEGNVITSPNIFSSKPAQRCISRKVTRL